MTNATVQAGGVVLGGRINVCMALAVHVRVRCPATIVAPAARIDDRSAVVGGGYAILQVRFEL